MKILTLFILFIPCVFAKSYYVKKDLPGELNLILESLAKMKLKEDEKKLLDEIIWKMDASFSLMKKEEMLFLVKASVYKTILGHRKKDERISGISPKEMEQLIKKRLDKDSYSNFSRWLLMAILSDYKNIVRSEHYKITHGGKKKLQRIMPWYRFFIETSAEEFELEFKDLYLLVLKKILIVSEGLLYHSHFDYKRPKSIGLHFFEYRESVPLIKEKSIDKILGSFPEDSQNTSPLTTPWRPKEDQRSNNLENLNYTPPDKLPVPVDEKLWAKQGGIEPDYTPPEKLPDPIDENTWVE